MPTILFGTLVCSLPFATASYADDFIGTGDGGSHGTSGSDFSGTVPDGTYDSIYGGFKYTGDKVVQNNTLNLTKNHIGNEILGGIAYDTTVGGTSGSATANGNTVNFTGGTCTNYLGGGTAFIGYSTGNASANKNSVNLTNVTFTNDGSQIHGGYTRADG